MPFLTETGRRTPSASALDDGEVVWSYETLWSEAESVARRMVSVGVAPGQVVALAGPLNRFLVAALHGIWMVGGVVAPLNARWSSSECRQALERLAPDYLLLGESTDEEWIPRPSSSGPVVLSLGFDSSSLYPNLAEVGLSQGALPEHGPERDACLILTSGTGGQPRVVRVSVGNLLSSALAAGERLGLAPMDRWLGSLSIAHIGGIALVSRAAFIGSCVVLRGPLSPTYLADLVGDGSITHASLVPTMLHQLLEVWEGGNPPETLRCLLIGGAPAGPRILRDALDVGFPLALTYGLTEASSQVATSPPALVRNKPGSVGQALPGVDVRLSPEGEILVRGPTVAQEEMGSDGWLHTGDLARMDEDGHLWITGRMSDRIISGGVNVDPAEVEQLLESHPSVEEVVVVGIPDEKWGERVVAGIVCREDSPELVAELNELAREELSPGKRPRELKVISAIPLNTNGKWNRGAVRSLFLRF